MSLQERPVPSRRCSPWMLEPQQSPGMAEGWLSLRAAEGQQGCMGDSSNLDDSLTSLQWLQEFSIINANVGKSSSCPSGPDPHDCHHIPGFAAPCSPLAADPACMGMPHTPGKPTSSSTSRSAHLGLHAQPPEDIDYKTNPHVKPPYSYATLICMAMEASKKTKITLSAIYKWITDNFCYFRHADPTWQVGALGSEGLGCGGKGIGPCRVCGLHRGGGTDGRGRENEVALGQGLCVQGWQREGAITGESPGPF